MIRRFVTAVALAVLAGCSGNSPMAPSAGGAGGGRVAGRAAARRGAIPGRGPAPTTAAVTVGNIFFKSGHNGSTNPAVDTVAAGGTVTWTWTGTGSIPHSVQSLGSPSFTSSADPDRRRQTLSVHVLHARARTSTIAPFTAR